MDPSRDKMLDFWTELGQKSEEFSSLLFTVISSGFYSLPPLSKSGLKLVCNVNIVYRNFKSENSQETSTKLYVHEFGFWMKCILLSRMNTFPSLHTYK